MTSEEAEETIEAANAFFDVARMSIMAACIARQVFDHIEEGRGPPGVEEMRRFDEEARAIAELWEEAVTEEE